jgi:FkbM family methyltransferase
MTAPTRSIDEMLGPDWRREAEARRSEIRRRAGGRTDVVLFGTGALGRQVHGQLPRPYQVVAYVDNNPAVWGTTVLGTDVLSPDEARTRFGDALWLITIYTNHSVIEQCTRLGVPWMTCAELSWILPEPHAESFAFGDPRTLEAFVPEIEAASAVWADDESRTEYEAQVRWRFLLDYAALGRPRPPAETYFPNDLVRPLADEVFVDCGAYTGDTVDAFLAARHGQFGAIVAIEPDVANCEALRRRMEAEHPADAARIRVEPVALGSTPGTLAFDASGTVRSKVGSGAATVQVATMDELLAGTAPTYIKYDIEGAEHDALVGGAATIAAHAPVLAVSLYHKPEDLWDLPLLVRSIQPRYRLYACRYSDERWEQVLYAVPPVRDVRSGGTPPPRRSR